MVTIWRVNVDPYDTTVYDEKHRRKTLLKSIEHLRIESRNICLNCFEKMRESGEI